MLALAAVALMACDKHDPFDDILITGEVGPQAYWTLESSMVSAGDSMGFTAQYYTSLKDQGVTIDSSAVWYNITESVEKTVSCPYVTFSISALATGEKRVMQFIKSYPHLEEYQNDSLSAYTFSSTFPVSGTLSPLTWVNPTIYSQDNVDNYFADITEAAGYESFNQLFKDSLEKTLTFEKCSTLLNDCGLNYIPEYIEDPEKFDFATYWAAYKDRVWDQNTNSWVPNFVGNKDSVSQTDVLYDYTKDTTYNYSGHENISTTYYYGIKGITAATSDTMMYSYRNLDTTYVAIPRENAADTTIIEYIRGDKWVFSFRDNIVVPQEITNVYKVIPFEDIIQKDDVYNIIYKRNYSLRAQLRVYDSRGVYGTTQAKEIGVN